jgi:hypothetical protein
MADRKSSIFVQMAAPFKVSLDNWSQTKGEKSLISN